jgi:hypothetical protein
MEDAVKSLKEFTWDIIGYLIPGFLLIVVFNFVVIPEVGIKNSFLIDWSTFGAYVYVVLSYILGYVVYSLTILKIRVQDTLLGWLKGKYAIGKYVKKKHSRSWEIEFTNSAVVKSARKHLTEQGYTDVDSMKLNEIRNILMSRDPTMDQKIYTFMFRSSVFDHISTIFILVVFVATAQYFFANHEIGFIKTEPIFKVLYLSLIFLIPLLGNCKRIFYSIAQRLPFSNLKK